MAMAIFWPLIAYYKQINKEANWRICSYIISELAISKARLQDFWKLFRNEEFFRKGARKSEAGKNCLPPSLPIFYHFMYVLWLISLAVVSAKRAKLGKTFAREECNSVCPHPTPSSPP